eukprot:718617-Rhodomonas_salina.1
MLLACLAYVLLRQGMVLQGKKRRGGSVPPVPDEVLSPYHRSPILLPPIPYPPTTHPLFSYHHPLLPYYRCPILVRAMLYPRTSDALSSYELPTPYPVLTYGPYPPSGVTEIGRGATWEWY